MTKTQDSNRQLQRLPASSTYEVGFGKPPEATRFKPGTSGNPRGRPKGRKNNIPSLSEERIKKLIVEEAYRTVPVVEGGRKVDIPMITAVLRAIAMNAARGNNRAATLFTTLVSKTEAENKKLATEAFGSAIDYKNTWSKELERRKRLGLKLPDPVPHPDDIVLDARRMEFRIAGPMTRDEIPRYKLAAELLKAYEEATAELEENLKSLPEGKERREIQRTIASNKDIVANLTPHYGPRSERTKDPVVKDVERIIGVPFDPDESEDDSQ